MGINPAAPPSLDPQARLMDRIATLERKMRTIEGFLSGGSVQQVPVVDVLPTAGREGRQVYLSTTNKLYLDNGASWDPQT
jgi:hypothetical protein